MNMDQLSVQINIFLIFLLKNVCYVYSLEVALLGASNEEHNMFLQRYQ